LFVCFQEPETEVKTLSFADFAACAGSWRERRVLLRAPLAAHPALRLAAASAQPLSEDEHLDALTPTPAAAASQPDALPPLARGAPAGALQELRRALDWAWLSSEVTTPLRLGTLIAATLLAASPRSLQPARYEDHDRLLCQASPSRAR
jgi:hypothetical protein